ncbi:hypothetical protein ACZ91_36365 [Streptomyces regensis]|nr:hypothetical protein ACZ91_36365 [Streptomyces regensis]
MWIGLAGGGLESLIRREASWYEITALIDSAAPHAFMIFEKNAAHPPLPPRRTPGDLSSTGNSPPFSTSSVRTSRTNCCGADPDRHLRRFPARFFPAVSCGTLFGLIFFVPPWAHAAVRWARWPTPASTTTSSA